MLILTFVECGLGVVNCLGALTVGSTASSQVRCELIGFGLTWGAATADPIEGHCSATATRCDTGVKQCWAKGTLKKAAAITCRDGYYLEAYITGAAETTTITYVNGNLSTTAAAAEKLAGAKCTGRIIP